MADEQLALDLPAAAPAFHLVTVCPWCGAVLEAVPVAEPGASWQPGVLWGYVAQASHNAAAHPEHV